MQTGKSLFLKSVATASVAIGLASCATSPAKEVISSKEAPAVLGPYAQAIKSGNMLFLSGQIPIDPTTNQISARAIDEQTKVVLENLKAVLAANKMSMDHIVSTSVFLKDLNDFGKMNAVYATYFSKDSPPARATVEVSRLPRDVLIEISAIAAR